MWLRLLRHKFSGSPMSWCIMSKKKSVQGMYTHNHNDTIIQLFPEGVTRSGGCVKVYI